MDHEINTISIGGWMLRARAPQGQGPFPLFVLLHGWTGDEDSMWIFASRLPQGCMMIAPRGPYPAPMGGYAWYPHRQSWPVLEDFRSAAENLSVLLTMENFPGVDWGALHLLGFSQGAALACAYALFYPGRAASVAGLSGFVPEGADALAADGRLAGLPVFLAHGTQDTLVPVALARKGASLLEQAGARVTYCEDDVGHKLSANCFRALAKFYQDPTLGRCS